MKINKSGTVGEEMFEPGDLCVLMCVELQACVFNSILESVDSHVL